MSHLSSDFENANNKGTHELLSSFVKSVHRRLKENYKDNISKGERADQVWEEHCADTQLLSQYANAMHQLAKACWNDNIDGSRITWCHNYIDSYFNGGILNKLRLKDLRRLQYNKTFNKSLEDAEVIKHPVDGRIRILDVGSCYNPFKDSDKFCVVALDLCPAVESVLQCDFLKLKLSVSLERDTKADVEHLTDTASLEKYLENLEGHLEWLPSNIFHVVVFSLFLDYLPSAEQRLFSCTKAHSLLVEDGILLVVCPDSRKQHRNRNVTRNWKTAIESVGFKRCTYEKLEHLHCMAFRKVGLLSPYSPFDVAKQEAPFWSSMVNLIKVPQDDRNSTVEDPKQNFDESQSHECGHDLLGELPLYKSVG